MFQYMHGIIYQMLPVLLPEYPILLARLGKDNVFVCIFNDNADKFEFQYWALAQHFGYQYQILHRKNIIPICTVLFYVSQTFGKDKQLNIVFHSPLTLHSITMPPY